MTDRDIATDAELDRLRARIAELEAQLAEAQEIVSNYNAVWEYYAARVERDEDIAPQALTVMYLKGKADAQAQLAERGEWEPVPDGEYRDIEINKGERIDIVAVDAFGVRWPAAETLPDNIRLCRRVQREGENE